MSLYDKYHSQQNKNYMYELINSIIKKEYDSDPTKIQSYRNDFSYTRRSMGAMDTIYKEDSTSLPKHNFIEDMYIVSNSSEPTPLFELVQGRGIEKFRQRTRFWKLPVNLPQIFQEFFIYGSIPLQHEAINYVYLVNENKKKDIK